MPVRTGLPADPIACRAKPNSSATSRVWRILPEVSDDASVDVCQNPELSIDKSAVLTDDSDCADTVGETISYTIVLDNIGNVALDNVVLEDNFEGGGNVTLTPFDDGDGILELGEHVLDPHVELVGEILDRHALGERNRARDWRWSGRSGGRGRRRLARSGGRCAGVVGAVGRGTGSLSGRRPVPSAEPGELALDQG